MKNKIIYKYVGKVLITFSLLMIAPIIVSLIFNENIFIFLIPLLFCLIVGILLSKIKVEKKYIYAKDGFIIVSLAWILISLFGALPFYLSHSTDYISGFFETVSGLTTTGATVFSDVESLSLSILFYRSFLHFIGGMGIITFVMAVIPLSKNDKSMYLLNAEMPGNNSGKIVSNTKKMLIYLYCIYFSLTLIQVILLCLGNVNLFDSLLISMSTISTGGFTFMNNSLANLSDYSKWIVCLFMFLSGVNFNIYFLLVIRKFKDAFKSEEFRVYIFITIISILFVFINTYKLYSNNADGLVNSAFHTVSIMTSTGFSTSNINIYPTNCRVLLLFLMLVSACGGSTCGGFKVSRLILAVKTIKRDILKIIHPNSVHIIKYDNKGVSEQVINSNNTFLFLYIILIIVIMFIVSFNGFNFDVTINAVFSTFANTGLCFNISDFGAFSSLSKIALSIGMLLGRLEIFPLIVLFSDLKK